MNAYERYSSACLGEQVQTWPHPSYLWMRCSGCSLPSGLVLRVLQWCCTSLRCYNGAAGLLRLLALKAGMASLRERHAFTCLTWPLLVPHGRAWTAQNPVQCVPSLQPSQAQGAAPSAARSHGDTTPGGTWSQSFLFWAILFNYPSWKSRAG